MRNRNHSRTWAFTLVELLVVLAVIGGLIAMLLPALQRARERGRDARCRANLRELCLAAQTYAADHGGRFPQAYSTVFSQGAMVSRNWDFTVTRGGGRTEVTPGVLFGQYTADRVFQCPSSPLVSGSDPHTGYNYNTSYIGHGDLEPNPEPALMGAVRDPAACALFGDGQYSGGPNKFMRAPFNDLAGGGDADPALRSAGTQGFRHLGRTNIGFCDGHVESLSERHLMTDSPRPPTEGTGFISADNSLYDLR
jgi:prepilin-type processing-associated H-X9-DG protein